MRPGCWRTGPTPIRRATTSSDSGAPVWRSGLEGHWQRARGAEPADVDGSARRSLHADGLAAPHLHFPVAPRPLVPVEDPGHPILELLDVALQSLPGLRRQVHAFAECWDLHVG